MSWGFSLHPGSELLPIPQFPSSICRPSTDLQGSTLRHRTPTAPSNLQTTGQPLPSVAANASLGQDPFPGSWDSSLLSTQHLTLAVSSAAPDTLTKTPSQPILHAFAVHLVILPLALPCAYLPVPSLSFGRQDRPHKTVGWQLQLLRGKVAQK